MASVKDLAPKKKKQESEEVILDIEVNEKRRVVAGVREYKGRYAVDIRAHYVDRQTGQWQPGKGLWIPIGDEQETLAEVEAVTGFMIKMLAQLAECSEDDAIAAALARYDHQFVD